MTGKNKSLAQMPTLVHRLETIVRRTPEAICIVQQGRQVSYSELWHEVCGVARFLKEQGLAREDRVALLLDNSIEYVTGYYGTLLAGGTVVALNPVAKARTHLHIIKHCDASWLIANGQLRELNLITESIEDNCQLILTSESHKHINHSYYSYVEIVNSLNQNDHPVLMSEPEQLAALIYTSGTTGDPKGVMLSHQNLLANTESIIEYLGLTADDSILNVLPFNYSYGNSVLHTHLAVGGRIVIENSMMFPQKVLERMSREQVTGFAGVPSTFALLLNRVKLKDYNLDTVRYMTQAGGPMPPSHIKRLISELPDLKFYVMYGQTEATARLTYLPPERLEEKFGSCGVAVPEVELKICSSNGRAVANGITGEINARGKNIMLGYWKNPESTKRVLVEGWLRTGDLAHKDKEGFIFIDGRSTDMIKSGAHRISPQEIEEVISELEEVAEVGVSGVPDDILGQVVKAFIITRDGINLDKKTVQRYCKKNLAPYKIPKHIDFVQDLPKTASGKIQRHRLK